MYAPDSKECRERSSGGDKKQSGGCQWQPPDCFLGSYSSLRMEGRRLEPEQSPKRQVQEEPERLPCLLLLTLHSVQTQELLLGLLEHASLGAKQSNGHLLGDWSIRGHGC